jgi:Family of unknown function (DUF6065)
MPHPTTASVVRFYRLFQQARLPQRADRSACGTLPTRAFRYCEAATSATSFGWWVFSPIDLWLIWDGADILWKCDGTTDWIPLLSSAQFPDFASHFDEAAPPDLLGYSPPFLTALPEAGTLQIWTGLFARTIPGWHLLVRAPANLPAPGGYVLYEGIIESDHWFGPLFTNLRFTRSDRPIRLRADFPLLQLQPIPGSAHSDATLEAISLVSDMRTFLAKDWDDYRISIVGPNLDPDRAYGSYATAVRMARRPEHSSTPPACP